MSLRVWLPLRGDLTNNGLDGDAIIVNNGITYNEKGVIGSCAYFNGSSYLEVSTSTNVIAKSICFWMKTTVQKQVVFVDNVSKLGFGFNTDSTQIIVSSENRSCQTYRNTAIVSDKWQHITLVDIGTDILLYVNGILETTRSSATYWNHKTSAFWIGQRSNGSSPNNFTGYLSDFRVYDHALSQKEINEISKGLILHYKLDNNTDVYDCSGYNNNATIVGSIGLADSSPRYSKSVKLNGSSSSVIKVTDNKWMAQAADAVTINFWAKAITWPTNGGRCVSCTQSGGFNLQAGNSGYWRFAMDVYTNAAQTSRAYQSDSSAIEIADLIPNQWNMITLEYDKTGSKTYLNGQLHHTYSKSNYGIHYNKNARLFLGCEANTANPTSPYFNGWLSDFRIYGTVLDAATIKELYQVQSAVDKDNNIYAREVVEDE